MILIHEMFNSVKLAGPERKILAGTIQMALIQAAQGTVQDTGG